MNRVDLTGRIGNIEVKDLDNGNKLTNLSVAVDDSYFEKKANEYVERTEWVKCVYNNETKFQIGDLVELSGKIKTRSFENKEGQKIYITEVVCRSIKLLHRKK